MMQVEFWPLKRVIEAVGLSKSEIYRQIAAHQFPAARSYKTASQRKFWASTEIARWQRDQVGDDFDALLR